MSDALDRWLDHRRALAGASENTIAAYRSYLQQNPDGAFAADPRGTDKRTLAVYPVRDLSPAYRTILGLAPAHEVTPFRLLARARTFLRFLAFRFASATP